MKTLPRNDQTIRDQYGAARAAQSRWAATPMRERVAAIRRVRFALAEQTHRFSGEKLAAEILPLASACKFLEKNAARILARRKLRRGRPLWLFGVEGEIAREAFGVVLVVAASNYPIFLPGVQLFQALVAGNAVLLKPGTNGADAAEFLAELCRDAQLDPNLVAILPDDDEAGAQAIELSIDKVFFTGSFVIGKKILACLAERAIPSVVELSGCDAAFVRDDADLELTARALAFALRLNGSETCIAPRRVFVARRLAERLEAELASLLRAEPAGPIDSGLTSALREALADGANTLVGGFDARGQLNLPCVLTEVRPEMRIMRTDTFAPWFCLTPTDGDDHALALAAQCPYSLGASIFSRDEKAARRLANRIRAGIVTINDLILPTADPRVPFGGRGYSGFGVTRGAEGLLEMTAPKVVQLRRGKFRPHYDPSRQQDAGLFRSFISATHSRRLTERVAAIFQLIRRGRK